MVQNDRLSAAIERNLNEVGSTILERKARLGIETVDDLYHGLDFIHFAHIALFNDMMARAIRVLDLNKDSTTFWYIYKHYKNDIDPYLSALRVDIQAICDMAKRLKHIRDTVIFHIDKEGVLNPEYAWNKANVKGDQLAAIMDTLWEVLVHIYKLHFGKEIILPEYTGEDATKIIKAAQDTGLIF